MNTHQPATGQQYLPEDEIIRRVLRSLGLTDRTTKRHGITTRRADFSVRGHYNEGHYRRTGERIREFTYVILWSADAHREVAANTPRVEAETAALGYRWYVTTEPSATFGTRADISAIDLSGHSR